jgi:hypothetical protein
MIIIEGPDSTGKTTLAKRFSEQFSLPYHHYTRESTYQDYLEPLCDLSLRRSVVDRWIFSEFPYSQVMEREFAFTLKQWHNIVLLTLAYKPLIILCTHEPSQAKYSRDQYLPYDKWKKCLELYRKFFNDNNIKYIEYDYLGPITINALNTVQSWFLEYSDWWCNMWRRGIGYIGSHAPNILLVAERIGPNNVNNLPFETGPTGHMLSEMLQVTGTPLGSFAVTNMVKSFRRDTRLPNLGDEHWLRTELTNLKPSKVVLMGDIAKRYGTKIAKEFNIEPIGMIHFGYYSHRGIAGLPPALRKQWGEIIGDLSIKEGKVEETRDRPVVPFTTTSF